MSAGLHISISAEPVLRFGAFEMTNSILTSLVVTGLIIALTLYVRANLKTSGKPSRLQALMELLVEAFRGLVKNITESDKKVEIFTPVILAFFMFIIFNNWIGLLPGVGTIGFTESPKEVRIITPVEASETVEPAKASAATKTVDTKGPESATPTESTAAEAVAQETPEHEVEKGTFVPYFRAGTADLNTTLALALISVALCQFYGFRFQKFSYFSKFINFSNPINFFVGLLETVLEFAKIMSFAFRLFGNIFAGEVLLAVMMFLIPLVVPMPFYGLEIFVGFIQALVFSILSLVFFNMATIGHGDEH